MTGRRRVNDGQAPMAETRLLFFPPKGARNEDTLVITAAMLDRREHRADPLLGVGRYHSGNSAHSVLFFGLHLGPKVPPEQTSERQETHRQRRCMHKLLVRFDDLKSGEITFDLLKVIHL